MSGLPVDDRALFPNAAPYTGCTPGTPCIAHRESGTEPLVATSGGYVLGQALPLRTTFVAACPGCGEDATWTATPGTCDIACATCDAGAVAA